MGTEDPRRLPGRVTDFLFGLVLFALALLVGAVAQARLRQVAEDALARTLVSVWLAARVEEWASAPYGTPLSDAAAPVRELIAEAGLSAAKVDFALRHRLCKELPCLGPSSFRAVEREEALRLGHLPQWEEASFALIVRLPSGREERIAVRLRRSPPAMRAAWLAPPPSRRSQ